MVENEGMSEWMRLEKKAARLREVPVRTLPLSFPPSLPPYLPTFEEALFGDLGQVLLEEWV